MTRRALRRALPAGALLLVSLVAFAEPRSARAESVADVENARALFVEAARRGGQGRWNEARDLYARSLQLKQAPLTRYSLGVAQRESGHLADALASFRTFVDEPQTPASSPYVEPARTAITALAARVGRVVLAVEPRPIAGLALSMDGQPIAAGLEGPREIDPGSHEVSARAPGYRAVVTRFLVAAGGSETVKLQLVSLSLPGGGARPPADSATAVAPPPAEPPAPAGRALPIALMAAGAATFVVGLSVGLVGVSQGEPGHHPRRRRRQRRAGQGHRRRRPRRHRHRGRRRGPRPPRDPAPPEAARRRHRQRVDPGPRRRPRVALLKR